MEHGYKIKNTPHLLNSLKKVDAFLQEALTPEALSLLRDIALQHKIVNSTDLSNGKIVSPHTQPLISNEPLAKQYLAVVGAIDSSCSGLTPIEKEELLYPLFDYVTRQTLVKFIKPSFAATEIAVDEKILEPINLRLIRMNLLQGTKEPSYDQLSSVMIEVLDQSWDRYCHERPTQVLSNDEFTHFLIWGSSAFYSGYQNEDPKLKMKPLSSSIKQK